MLTPSPACYDLVRQSEGLQLKAYRCPAGILTIGFGHCGPDVKEGMRISLAQAEQLLEKDLEWAADTVRQLALPCTQGQFDALTDFTFNLGGKRFQDSTLRKYHLNGQYTLAAKEFGRWVRGGGKILPGLVKRRAAEAHLYLSGEMPPSHDAEAA